VVTKGQGGIRETLRSDRAVNNAGRSIQQMLEIQKGNRGLRPAVSASTMVTEPFGWSACG